jgi:glutamine amidotransferase-like uncharacterized protein
MDRIKRMAAAIIHHFLIGGYPITLKSTLPSFYDANFLYSKILGHPMQYLPFLAITLTAMMCLPVVHPAESPSATTVYKQIAVYPSIVPAIKVLQYALQYGWTVDNVTYRFNVTEIDRDAALSRGQNPLSPDLFDVLVIGASARQYIHGIDSRWKNNVQTFVTNGGGYVGICGGANAASLGLTSASNLIDRVINAGSLGIANVYVNDHQDQEWQYLYKSSGLEGGIPVSCTLTDHPIVSVSPTNPRVIRYEGGPGLYVGNSQNPLHGEIVPLAIYAEEISQKGPIHYWEKINNEWQQNSPIITDVKGQSAAIATTYGAGRVALFGPHPEERTTIGNGFVEEFPGRSKYSLFQETYLYKWVGGDETNWSYNWWMVRRAVAWAAGIPEKHLPPIRHIEIFLTEPSVWNPGLYLQGRRVGPAPWGNTIIGAMSFTVDVSVNSTVDFYLDGTKYFSDSLAPYEWPMEGPFWGSHLLMAEMSQPDGTTAYAQANLYLFNW